MKIQATGATDIGRERSVNEDSLAIHPDLQLYIVSDGMGGHAAGEVASQKAVEFFEEEFRERLPSLQQKRKEPGGYYRLLEAAEDAVQSASRRICRLAQTRSDLAGMGTTLTMLMIVDNKAVMSHVGDSRLYLLRDNRVHLLSTDHTLAHELVAAGGLTEEEARESQLQHALTRAVGQQEMVDVESLLFDVMPGDTFLLCSDGLSKYFHDRDELTGLLGRQQLEPLTNDLIALANQRGGSDNITAVLVRVPAPADDQPPPQVADCLEVLRNSTLFRGLPLSRLMRIVNIATVDRWNSGDVLLPAGGELQGLHYVVSGRLSFGDRELQHGGAFGESALLHPHPSPVTVSAAEETRTLFIPGQQFDNMARRVPRLGRRLMRRLALLLSQQVAESHALLEAGLPDTGVWREYD